MFLGYSSADGVGEWLAETLAILFAPIPIVCLILVATRSNHLERNWVLWTFSTALVTFLLGEFVYFMFFYATPFLVSLFLADRVRKKNERESY
ncbi:hypothetical protein [Parashewanella tropica]|uniref:hypothetical protein n=1 Tax=Parashewanella tropica TaxID=2547970 RepID=UPI001059ED6A|nr:hypothetical protein [Parashewanella tropica]